MISVDMERLSVYTCNSCLTKESTGSYHSQIFPYWLVYDLSQVLCSWKANGWTCSNPITTFTGGSGGVNPLLQTEVYRWPPSNPTNRQDGECQRKDLTYSSILPRIRVVSINTLNSQEKNINNLPSTAPDYQIFWIIGQLIGLLAYNLWLWPCNLIKLVSYCVCLLGLQLLILWGSKVGFMSPNHTRTSWVWSLYQGKSDPWG